MNSQALASVLAGNSPGVSTGRKMDRVFTQSMGAQTVSPRYMRNNARNGNRNTAILDNYMMERSLAYNQAGTHYRTISGSGGVDEYDYVPTPANYRYDRQPIRRRVRGQAMRSYARNGDRRYVSRAQAYEDGVPARNRYRQNSRRNTYRSGEWYNDEAKAPAPRKPPRRRRVSQRSRANTDQPAQSESQQPQEETSNEEGRRTQRVARRRTRRTTSNATTKEQTAAAAPTAGRGRRFACNICRKAFRTDSLRIRHIRFVHPRRREFVCKQCRGVFPNARSITTHLSKPHPEEREPADEQRRYPPLGVPTRYVPEGMTIFSCQYCPFGFLNARDAESHKSRCRASQRLTMNIDVEYPGNDQYTMYCFCCPELLSLRQGLKEHFDCLHSHIELNICYHCALCSKKFELEQDAADHIKKNHSAEELEQLQKKRQESFIEESIVSYQSARPVSMVRTKVEVRQVLAKLLRQVAAKVRSSSS